MTDKIERILAFIEERIKWNTKMMKHDYKPSDIGRIEEAKCIRRFIDSMQKEPASGNIDFEQELYKAFGQVKDFTLGMQIAKWFYDMGKNSQEPVSEELDEAASSFARKDSEGISNSANFYYTVADKARIFKSGAKWQIARLMKDAIDVTVHIDAGNYPYIPQMELYDYDKDAPLAKEGDKYKVILIKEK